MSDQEKVASKNSLVGSNHCNSGEDLSDVSASESELVGDDTKSLNFGKTLMDEAKLDRMVTNRMLERASVRLPEGETTPNLNLMNVLFFRINLLLVFACLVKTLLKKF